MKLENQQFLNANRHHYDLLVNAGIVKHLDMATRQTLLNVIHEEFNPAYLGQLWCQSCIADMIRFAYVQYDKWIEQDSIMNGEGEGDKIEGLTGLINQALDGSVKAESFPVAHKPKRARKSGATKA